MTLSSLLLFLPACFALNMAPGPNNLLSIANAGRYGFRQSCLAGAGRLVGFAGMIALSGAGLAMVLQTSEKLFYAIKIAGGVYLLYLAWQMWRTDSLVQVDVNTGNASLGTLIRQEFLVAIGNPKAILIFTAFLPQFIVTSQPASSQFLSLGLIFLALECIAISIYAFLGIRISRFLASPSRRRWFNRSLASLLGLAGVGLLAMKRH